jgi:membrane protease YdiL (CAAX protease family)
VSETEPIQLGATDRARDDARSIAQGLCVWLLLWTLPAAFAARLGAPEGAALALLCIALLLVSTRSGAGDAAPARAVATFVLASLAGAASLPVWIAGLWPLGLRLGLPPRTTAPAPAGLAALLAPAAEELLYRERLLPPLRRRLGAGLAVVATSALFALPHLEPWLVLATFCVGLALGFAMLCTGSTALCLGYHLGLNLTALSCALPPCGRPTPGGVVVGAALLAAALRSARPSRPGRGPVRRLPARALLLFAGATALQAPVPARADLLAWTGRLSFEALPPAIPDQSITGAGVAEVLGSSGAALRTLRLDGGIEGTALVPITDPVVTAGGLAAVALEAQLGSGTLHPFFPPASPVAPQLTRAVLPVRGRLRHCFLNPTCMNTIEVPLDTTTPQGSFGVGVGGIATRDPLGAQRVSLVGAPWTVRTAVLELSTTAGGSAFVGASGFVHGPSSFTGSTALVGGALQLVTPVVVSSLGGSVPATGFVRLDIRFVPEARRFVALCVGALVLLLLAFRRPPLEDS